MFLGRFGWGEGYLANLPSLFSTRTKHITIEPFPFTFQAKTGINDPFFIYLRNALKHYLIQFSFPTPPFYIRNRRQCSLPCEYN